MQQTSSALKSYRRSSSAAAVERSDPVLPRRASTDAVPVLDLERDVVCLFGIAFDRVSLSDAVLRTRAAIRDGTRHHLVTPNVNILRLAQSDPQFRTALLAADLSIADGMPLIWLSRLLGLGLPERVAGSDVFEAFVRDRSQTTRVFFFGGTESVGHRLSARFRQIGGGIECSGTLAPGFGSLDGMSGEATINAINRSRNDMVVVAVGAVKGLQWIGRNESRLHAPVVANLGAVINFAAGTVHRAPVLWRKSGFEWLWRIRQEPQLWRRYAADLRWLAWTLAVKAIPLAALHLWRSVPWLNSRVRRPFQIEVRLETARAGKTIRLSGRFTGDDLGLLREALASAIRYPASLTLELDAVTELDAASLGLILMVHGQLRRRGHDLAIKRPGWRLRLLLSLHGCGFLMRPLQKALASPVVAPPIKPLASGGPR